MSTNNNSNNTTNNNNNNPNHNNIICQNLNNPSLPLWACIRDKIIGFSCLLLFILALYGALQTSNLYRRTRFYALNALFLWLVTLQTFVDFLGRLFIQDDRTDFFSLFMRMIEINTACITYAHFALDSRGEGDKFKSKILPIAFLFFIAQTILFSIALADDDGQIECAKPMWLIGSVSNLALSLLFLFYGWLALNEVIKIAQFTTPYSDSSVSFVQPGILRKRRELWACVLVFLISSICQVSLDSWSMSVSTQTDSLQSCYEREGSGWLAFWRIILEFISIFAPPFVLVLIFYVELRWQFSAPEVILGSGSIDFNDLELTDNSTTTAAGNDNGKNNISLRTNEQRLISPSLSGLHERSLLSEIEQQQQPIPAVQDKFKTSPSAITTTTNNNNEIDLHINVV
jgi:hypothetical protein